MSQYSFLICSAPIGRGIRKSEQSHGTAVSHSLHCAFGAAYSTQKLFASFLIMAQIRMPMIIVIRLFCIFLFCGFIFPRVPIPPIPSSQLVRPHHWAENIILCALLTLQHIF